METYQIILILLLFPVALYLFVILMSLYLGISSVMLVIISNLLSNVKRNKAIKSVQNGKSRK